MKKLTALLLLISFFANSQSSKAILEMDSYSFIYPKDWKIVEGCVENQCTINSLRDSLLNEDTYVESINFTVNDLASASYTAQQYANFSVDYLPKVVEGFAVLENKKLSQNCQLLVYKGKKDDFDQTWMQYYYVANSKVYIVTFSAESRKFELYKPMLLPYLESFYLK